MSVRLMLTDGAWAELVPILATLKSRAGSPPVLSDRLFVEAVLSLARTGTPWRHRHEAKKVTACMAKTNSSFPGVLRWVA